MDSMPQAVQLPRDTNLLQLFHSVQMPGSSLGIIPSGWIPCSRQYSSLGTRIYYNCSIQYQNVFHVPGSTAPLEHAIFSLFYRVQLPKNKGTYLSSRLYSCAL
jgi:hypothetical protein